MMRCGIGPRPRRGGRRPALRAVLLAGALLVAPHRAVPVEFGPQGLVRQFCRADGLGERVTRQGWPTIAPLVTWEFEPAWDRVLLITGYEVGNPQPGDGPALVVEVRYTVIAHLSALGRQDEARIDTVRFRVDAPDEFGWRIHGPPPVPRLFASRVDADHMLRSLKHGGTNFVSNTLFIWRMFQSAGWAVPYVATTALLHGSAYRPVDAPAPGDVVAYLDHGVPYHAGLLHTETEVVSSTLNAGVVRTPLEAFPGQMTYLRMVEPEATATAAGRLTPTPGPSPPPAPPQPSPAETAGPQAGPPPTGQPTPVASRPRS